MKTEKEIKAIIKEVKKDKAVAEKDKDFHYAGILNIKLITLQSVLTPKVN